jgi:sec-independent protein translocase protein TatA
MRVGTNEVLIILLVALIVFGPQQLPKLGKMFGKTMKNFQEGMAAADEDKSTDAASAETKAEADTASEKKGV